MNKIALFILLTISNVAFTCSDPIGGPEYDSQIIVTKLEQKNSYSVSVPRYMKNMPNEAQIILAYSGTYAGGIPVYEKNEILNPKVVGDNLVVKFNVFKKEKRPYIVVMWWHEFSGMCGIQANTKFIEVE